jgi:hypothetical protein
MGVCAAFDTAHGIDRRARLSCNWSHFVVVRERSSLLPLAVVTIMSSEARTQRL